MQLICLRRVVRVVLVLSTQEGVDKSRLSRSLRFHRVVLGEGIVELQ
jgi:hypothetical protein